MCHGANAQIGDADGAGNSFCPPRLNRSLNLRYAGGGPSSAGVAEREAQRRYRCRTVYGADWLADPSPSGNSRSSSGKNGAYARQRPIDER